MRMSIRGLGGAGFAGEVGPEGEDAKSSEKRGLQPAAVPQGFDQSNPEKDDENGKIGKLYFRHSLIIYFFQNFHIIIIAKQRLINQPGSRV